MMLDSCQQELKKMVIWAVEDGTSDRAVRFCMCSQSEPEAVGSEDPLAALLNREAGTRALHCAREGSSRWICAVEC